MPVRVLGPGRVVIPNAMGHIRANRWLWFWGVLSYLLGAGSLYLLELLK